MPEWHGEQIVETTTEARQGVTGHNVRYVLDQAASFGNEAINVGARVGNDALDVSFQ
jgi:hypothetical protein